MHKLRWPVRLYVVGVIGTGVAALLAAGLWSPLPAAIQPSVIVVLFAMAAVPHVWPIHLSTKMKLTTDDTATFAAAILFGPLGAMLLALAASIVPSRLPTRTPLYNQLFNTAATVVSLGSAGTVYLLLAGGAGVLARGRRHGQLFRRHCTGRCGGRAAAAA